MSTDETSRAPISFLLGLLAGATIGAATAILLAPQSGEDTRHMLDDKMTEAKKTVSKQLEAVRGKASDSIDSAREMANDALENVSGKMADLKDKVAEIVPKDVQDKIAEQIGDKVSAVVSKMGRG